MRFNPPREVQLERMGKMEGELAQPCLAAPFLLPRRWWQGKTFSGEKSGEVGAVWIKTLPDKPACIRVAAIFAALGRQSLGIVVRPVAQVSRDTWASTAYSVLTDSSAREAKGCAGSKPLRAISFRNLVLTGFANLIVWGVSLALKVPCATGKPQSFPSALTWTA